MLLINSVTEFMEFETNASSINGFMDMKSSISSISDRWRSK